MKSTDTAMSKCWHCGTEFDAATDLTGDAVPKEGDISICIRCGYPAVFNKDLTVRRPTEPEMKIILKSEQALDYMMAVRRRKGRK